MRKEGKETQEERNPKRRDQKEKTKHNSASGQRLNCLPIRPLGQDNPTTDEKSEWGGSGKGK